MPRPYHVGVYEQPKTGSRYTVNGVATRFQSGRGARRHHDRRRHAAHAASHGAQPDDRRRVDDYTVMEIAGTIDADARAVHASDEERKSALTRAAVELAQCARTWHMRRDGNDGRQNR